MSLTISVLVYLLFGVSAKHLSDDVSTTVSQNDTTGSATLISVIHNTILMMYVIEYDNAEYGVKYIYMYHHFPWQDNLILHFFSLPDHE